MSDITAGCAVRCIDASGTWARGRLTAQKIYTVTGFVDASIAITDDRGQRAVPLKKRFVLDLSGPPIEDFLEL